MDESGPKAQSLILDTNILFAALIKTEGFTQAVLSILLTQKEMPVLIPAIAKQEAFNHLPEISRKAGVPSPVLGRLFSVLFGAMTTIEEETFPDHIRRALALVSDKADAPFCGLALRHAPSILLTYNTQDFLVEDLKKEGVLVLTPSELVAYFEMEIDVRKQVGKKGGLLRLLSSLYVLRKGKAFSWSDDGE